KIRNMQTLFALNYDVPYIDGLKARVQMGYDYKASLVRVLRKSFENYRYTYNTATNEETYEPVKRNDPPFINITNDDLERVDVQAQLSYNKMFNDVHNIGAMFLFESKNEKNN